MQKRYKVTYEFDTLEEMKAFEEHGTVPPKVFRLDKPLPFKMDWAIKTKYFCKVCGLSHCGRHGKDCKCCKCKEKRVPSVKGRARSQEAEERANKYLNENKKFELKEETKKCPLCGDNDIPIETSMCRDCEEAFERMDTNTNKIRLIT